MLTWQVAGPRARVCGYCGPTRIIAIGDRYLEVGTRPAAVRCVDCATTRWGLEPPAELPVDEAGVAADAPMARPWLDWVPQDWKQRAARDT